MTRPTTAVLGPMAWDDVHQELIRAFSLRREGVNLNGDSPSVNTSFGFRELAADLGTGAIALDVESGQRVALPDEWAGKLVLATLARFPDELQEDVSDVLLLSGKRIPSNLAIGIGREATEGILLARATDSSEGLGVVYDSSPRCTFTMRPGDLLDYDSVQALFPKPEQAEAADVANVINHNGAH